MTAGTREIVLPVQGNPFAVTMRDFREAIALAPIWLRWGSLDVLYRFRRTWLGPFWHTLSLGAFVLTMGVIWSTVLHQDPGHYFRYVTTNLMVWTLISSMITEGSGVLIAGQETALSIRFPYPAFAFGHVWRGLLLFAHHFLLYVIVMAATLHSPGWTALLAIPGLLLLTANGVWMTLLAGILCLRRRDLSLVIASAMQIAMFVTPIFWPKDLLGPKLAFAADYNPFFHLVLIIRDPLLGKVPPAVSWLWVLGSLAVGTIVTAWVYGRSRNRLPYWY